MHVLTQGVESLDEYITQFLPARLLAALVPALVLLVVALLDPWTLPVLLFAGPLLVVLLALIGARTRDLTRRREAELAWMSAHFLDLLRGMTTLKLFGRSRDQTATIGAIGRRYGDTMMGVLRTAFQTSLVLEWGATAATALVAIEVSFRLMHGLMPFERALAVLLVTPEFFLPLRQLALKYHAGTAGKAGAERLYALLDTPLPAAPPAPARRPPPAPRPARPALRGRAPGLWRGRAPPWPGSPWTWRRGRRWPWWGPPGPASPPWRASCCASSSRTGARSPWAASPCARSTPRAGGGRWPGCRSTPTCSTARWPTTCAWRSRTPPRRSCVGAARAAHADELIAGLPQGYDTPLGEGGARLSGGQAQRIAIARAFLKADAAGADTRACPPWGAPLLILDEPTSHLDDANEAGIREALERLSERRTVLLISHRPALVAAAHQVAVMAGGRVVQTSLNRPRWDPPRRRPARGGPGHRPAGRGRRGARARVSRSSTGGACSACWRPTGGRRCWPSSWAAPRSAPGWP